MVFGSRVSRAGACRLDFGKHDFVRFCPIECTYKVVFINSVRDPHISSQDSTDVESQTLGACGFQKFAFNSACLLGS